MTRPDRDALIAAAAAAGSRIRLLDSGSSTSTSSAAGDAAELPAALVEAVSALNRDADRAVRYLNLGPWDSIVVDCTDGVLALARASDEVGVALVSSPAGTPGGAAQRLATRAAALSEPV